MSAEISAETAIKRPMPEIFIETPLVSDQLDSPDAQPLSRSAFDKLRSTRLGQALAVGGAVLAIAGGEALNADKADASTSPAQVTEMTSSQTILIGKSKSSADSISKAFIIGNHRTVAQAKIKEAQQNGDCEYFTGKEAMKAGIQTQGYNGTGVGYAYENRGTTACDTNNDGDYDVRVECGNKIIFRKPKPEKAKYVVWVNNFNQAQLKIKSKAVAQAYAACKTPDGLVSASAFGRGVGKSSVVMKLRNVVKAKSKNIKKLITQSATSAQAEAESHAKAAAEAECQQSIVPIPVIPPEKPPVTPPPEQPQNQPPNVDLVDHQHSDTENIVQVCAYGDDPDGQSDIVTRQITESGDGNFVSPVYLEDEPGEFCRDFAPGNSAGQAVITAKVIDKAGNSASDTEDWEIVHRPS